MSKRKGNEGIMANKIDLENAYNHLEWSFIKDTLSLFKFLEHLISMIISCVSSSIFVLFIFFFGGGALEPFQPSRGIRQRGHLSPYLFIICTKVLGVLIAEKCDAKLWNPIKASRGGIASFSHLFFNSLMTSFSLPGTTRRIYVAVKDALDTFCELSNQKVSSKKSKFFFFIPYPNVSPLYLRGALWYIGFSINSFLGKIFRIPHQAHYYPIRFQGYY